MKIAELFLELGVKGDSKSVKAMQTVHAELGGLVDSGLAAKAAIVGAVYALERFSASVTGKGTALKEFEVATGLSADALQQWQYELMQFGVSGDQVAGTLKGIQSTMASMKANEPPPKWFQFFQQITGADWEKMRDAKTGPFYMMEQLRKFAQSDVSQDMKRMVMNAMGVSDALVSGLGQSHGDISKNPIEFGAGQRDALQRTQAQWQKLWYKVEKEFGGLIAKHGPKMVSELGTITGSVMRLVDALAVLTERMRALQIIGKAIEGWNIIFKSAAEFLEESNKHPKGSKEYNSVSSAMGRMFDDMLKGDFLRKIMGEPEDNPDFMKDGARPSTPPAPGRGQTSMNTTNNISVYADTNDPREHADVIAKEIQNSVQQSFGLVQVS